MTEFVLQIIRIGLQIVQAQLGGKPLQITYADAILEMISLGKAAYEKEAGQPIDVDKIKPYEPF